MSTRRNFLKCGAAAAGAVTVLPSLAFAAGHGGSYDLLDGRAKIHPISHASFVLETPGAVLYVDPVGDAAQYADMPTPDNILITHRHGDHYKQELLDALPAAPILTNADVAAMLPGMMAERTETISPGGSTMLGAVGVEAVPSYNITDGRMNFHPPERGDIGFVLTIDGARMYVSGDTEGTPEMRALQDIDLALVCMNLPFTMSAEQAADAVAEFAPKMVIPYHYRGRDGGTQDPKVFAKLLGDAGAATIVMEHDWYNGALG